MVTDKAGRGTELVVEILSEVRIQFGNDRVGLVVHAVSAVVEHIACCAHSVIVVIRIVVLVADSQFMVLVDVPVDTCQ